MKVNFFVNFLQERNRLFLTRAVVLELVHAVKFRSSLPDTNLQSVLQVRNQWLYFMAYFSTSIDFSWERTLRCER